MNITPWAADSATYLATPLVQHTYAVYNEDAASPVLIPGAHNVKVTLDRSSVPFGTVTFDVPGRAIPSATPGIVRGVGTKVRVDAGWIRNGVPDVHPICRAMSYPLRPTIRTTADSTLASYEFHTVDSVLEFPSNQTYDVANTYTRIKQVTDYMNASKPWTRLVSIVEGSITAPTAAQLATFRALNIDTGDNVGDWLRMLAASLGQWIRPDHRNAYVDLLVSDPATNAAAGELDLTPFTVSDEWAELGNYANVLDLTMRWDDTKSSRRTYLDPDMLTGVYYGDILTKAVSLFARPANNSSTLTATDPTALAWLDRITRTLGTHTVTTRAAWWLQPGDWVKIGYPYTDRPSTGSKHQGNIDKIVYDLDAGTMAVTFDAIYLGS